MAGRRLVSGVVFDLRYRASGASEVARLGLIIPKRLARSASLRNAIKRQCREAFRLMAIDIPPCDLVLRLTRPLEGVKARDGVQRKAWRADVEDLLTRLPILPR